MQDGWAPERFSMSTRIGIRRVQMTGVIAVCSAVGAWAGEANYQPYVVGERAAGMGGADSGA